MMRGMIDRYAEQLAPFLPPNTAEDVARWIVELRVSFVVAKPRRTKLGDFRVERDGKNPRISVNGDLNPYAFLVTTIHEFAHLGCFLKHRGKVAPHGAEWKEIYVDMLEPFVRRGVFPNDLARALTAHMRNPKASSCSCPVLSRALAQYDERPGTFLGDLSPGEVFFFGTHAYEFVRKRRTRCLCQRVSDGKSYLISGDAQVVVMSPMETGVRQAHG